MNFITVFAFTEVEFEAIVSAASGLVTAYAYLDTVFTDISATSFAYIQLSIFTTFAFVTYEIWAHLASAVFMIALPT